MKAHTCKHICRVFRQVFAVSGGVPSTFRKVFWYTINNRENFLLKQFCNAALSAAICESSIHSGQKNVRLTRRFFRSAESGGKCPKIRLKTKKGPSFRKVLGAGEVNRTLDLLITNQLLYRLSHSSITAKFVSQPFNYNRQFLKSQRISFKILPSKQFF